MRKCIKCKHYGDCHFIVKITDEDKVPCVCTKFLPKDESADAKKLYDLLYIVRTNMTSITRYIRHKREGHPNLTEGQFLDRHLQYKDLADVAIKNILEYINEVF